MKFSETFAWVALFFVIGAWFGVSMERSNTTDRLPELPEIDPSVTCPETAAFCRDAKHWASLACYHRHDVPEPEPTTNVIRWDTEFVCYEIALGRE